MAERKWEKIFTNYISDNIEYTEISTTVKPKPPHFKMDLTDFTTRRYTNLIICISYEKISIRKDIQCH